MTVAATFQANERAVPCRSDSSSAGRFDVAERGPDDEIDLSSVLGQRLERSANGLDAVATGRSGQRMFLRSIPRHPGQVGRRTDSHASSSAVRFSVVWLTWLIRAVAGSHVTCTRASQLRATARGIFQDRVELGKERNQASPRGRVD